jgi:ATP-binding cassette, subfamily B, multidrug efflux pump
MTRPTPGPCALCHLPAVLGFDGATSALDVHTERRLFAALDAIAGECTLVMIAQRLETAAKAGGVIVLDTGRVVDAGSSADVAGQYPQGVDR